MIAVLIAGSVAMILSLFGTRWLIAIFDSLGKGQPILGSEDHGPVHHMKKQGTATMGGIAIIFAAFIGWLVAHLRGGIALSDQAMIMWAGVGVLSLMGFLDDFLKVRKSHNRGILWKKKGYITFAMVIGLMWWLLAGTGISETLSFTRSDFPGWNLSPVLWVVWTAIMVWATTNAVNVTDGLDGLAAGSALFGFLAFTVIAYWGFRNPDVYNLVNPLDLAVFSAAMAAAVRKTSLVRNGTGIQPSMTTVRRSSSAERSDSPSRRTMSISAVEKSSPSAMPARCPVIRSPRPRAGVTAAIRPIRSTSPRVSRSTFQSRPAAGSSAPRRRGASASSAGVGSVMASTESMNQPGVMRAVRSKASPRRTRTSHVARPTTTPGDSYIQIQPNPTFVFV